MAENDSAGFLHSLQEMSTRLEEIDRLLSTPEVAQSSARLQPLMRERGRLVRHVEPYRKWQQASRERAEAEAMAAEAEDAEMQQLAGDEASALRDKEQELLEALREMVLESQDRLDAGSLILEVRAGTGGDEAALFAGDLFEMYRKFCERRGWKFETMSASPTPLGGYREVVVGIEGDGAFREMAFESGGHRVQRVPETEAQGRIHTSAATVAVMPEPEELDIELKDADLKVETMRSSGPGGQNVNKVSSAVRMTHLPTGIAVMMQESKSQHQNREKAMRLMRSRVFDHYESERRAARDADRKLKVGSGDRSARVRTYNFPQNRVTDHRIGYTAYNLDAVMQGQLDELVEALLMADREDRLAKM
jgi:peptide chain release factor 1